MRFVRERLRLLLVCESLCCVFLRVVCVRGFVCGKCIFS